MAISINMYQLQQIIKLSVLEDFYLANEILEGIAHQCYVMENGIMYMEVDGELTEWYEDFTHKLPK